MQAKDRAEGGVLASLGRVLRRRPHPAHDPGATDRLMYLLWQARAERDELAAKLQVAEARLAQLTGAEPRSPSAAKGLLVEPMTPLPTDPSDPRLEGWYHTIELAPGVVTRNAIYDHRSVVDWVGLPESLAGKTALDIATADGFWAFELERRGADRVVAVDIVELGDSDVIPTKRAQVPATWATSVNYCAPRFATAHAMRQSRVEFHASSVYALSPETVGMFDVVYCGDLLVHLFNPLQALINIRSVTREMAIIETPGFHDEVHEAVERPGPERPLMWFGSCDWEREGELGSQCMYWRFTERALHDMLRYAGFSRVEPRGRCRFRGPGGGDLMMISAVGYV